MRNGLPFEVKALTDNQLSNIEAKERTLLVEKIGLADLPHSWAWTKLENVAACKKNAIVDGPFGSNLKTSDYIEDKTGVPVLTTKNLTNGYGKEYLRYISQEKFEELKRSEVRSRDILVAKIGSCGKTGIYPVGMPSAIIPANLLKMTVHPTISDLYVYYFLNSPVFEQELGLIITATAQPAFNVSKFRQLAIPLAPFAEQLRIVSAIEQQFTRLDAGVAALKKAQAKLKRYRAAVLKAAVEGKLTETWRAEHPTTEPASMLLERILKERRAKWETDLIAKGKDPAKVKYVEPAKPDMEGLPELPEGWCWATVGQIGNINEQVVLTGPFGSNLGREDFIDSGVPVLTIGCLTEQGLTLKKAFYVSDEKAFELIRYRVRTGDILFSRMASVGRADLVSEQLEGSIINYHLMRLRLAEKVINPNYFISYVRGSYTLVDYIKEVNHGVTRDGINTNQLLVLPVALPPLAEQEQIKAELEQRLSIITQLEATVEANLKRAERLRQSILKEAFAGRLVPQDPNDEPASVLLERIRKEREVRKKGIVDNGRYAKVSGEPVKIDVEEARQVELWEGVGG